MLRYGFKDILPAVERRKACLPAFDIGGGQRDILAAVLEACEAARCPALLLVWAPPGGRRDLQTCADLVGSLAERASVPVVLHLDHAREEQVVADALDSGLRSIMFDASACPLEENIRRTRAMAELAHARGATFEGELGRIGALAGEDGLTDPDQARRYVEATGVDILAPAVGNVHGFYNQPPALQFDLIRRIADAAGVPLSLHGGTGISHADIRTAASLGFRKLNVATALHHAFGQAIRQAAIDQPAERFSWRKTLQAGRAAVGEIVAEYLRELNVGELV